MLKYSYIYGKHWSHIASYYIPILASADLQPVQGYVWQKDCDKLVLLPGWLMVTVQHRQHVHTIKRFDQDNNT